MATSTIAMPARATRPPTDASASTPPITSRLTATRTGGRSVPERSISRWLRLAMPSSPSWCQAKPDQDVCWRRASRSVRRCGESVQPLPGEAVDEQWDEVDYAGVGELVAALLDQALDGRGGVDAAELLGERGDDIRQGPGLGSGWRDMSVGPPVLVICCPGGGA